MRVCVVYVDTCAMTVIMASTSGNKDFLSEYFDLNRSLPVLSNVRSEIYKNRNLKSEEYKTRQTEEINPDAAREMIAKHAESLIENNYGQFKKH
jgi:hypothetical protein